ncbi:hypothetical protein ACG04R_24380 [Roseateles sp. BYS78W]|uniref:Secretion system X translation initiation factor n=1 Tax=Pelomonas candidula TaxID=3299025 RepID=A0ABW7HIW5_9BURK
MKKPAPRQLALFGALGLSLAATAWVSRDDAAEPVAAEPSRRTTAAAAPSNQANWPGPAASARAAWPAADMQARAAWGEAPSVAAAPAPPPPAESVDAPPPAPTAPPFPYQFVGRLTDGAARAVLDSPRRSTVVGAGDVVDGQWRVDAVEAGGLRLTYLPLGLAQFIPFAAA